MIELFGQGTPNIHKVLIALEELRLDYRVTPVDIQKGEQFSASFLAIGPNNRVPVIVDHDPNDRAGPLSVFESGAILLYLADKHDALIPRDPRARSAVMEWLFWQVAGQGPMLGQAGYFRNYAAEKIPHGIERYTTEAGRLYRVLDRRLAEREYIAGAYSIADIACWPWVMWRDYHGVTLADFPQVERWFHDIKARPAVRRALCDFEPGAPHRPSDEDRAVLFLQTGK